MTEYSDIKEDVKPEELIAKSDSIDAVSSADDNSEGGSIGTSSEVIQLREELEEMKNRSLRALADLENYRVRSNRQIIEERKYASIDLIRELLAVWDNIGRALDAVNKTQNLETLVEGVNMVHQQFLDILAKYNCEKIDAVHQPFDPNFHASIAQVPNEDFPPNTVIEEILTGFKLHDRVVRPAQVVLSSGKQVSG
ncbi:MAG: nucleotide exchange factor GrpE [Planctomycetaceae bacterium]|jgi:molecular chaperone GrpE|nr:nucleotide exchange factor GrpE [Planctomycetaceae bacterium]